MAIAFDTFTNGGSFVTTTTRTFSHTSSGSDRIAFVFAGVPNPNDIVTGITYAGVAMTKIASIEQPDPGLRWVSFWYIIAPATGAQDVVITCSSAPDAMDGACCSYTGAKQTGQPDAFATNTSASTTSLTTSVTTVADNCWTIICGRGGVNAVAGTGMTSRGILATDNTTIIGDSNADLTPAGSKSLQITSDSGAYGVVMASFSPAVATTTEPINRGSALLGVGQ